NSVSALATVPGQPIVLVGTAEGEVEFVDWPGQKSLGRVQAPGTRLTSLQVSPDGSFMATGDSDASFTLWDLRPLLIKDLFSGPLSLSSVNQLMALDVLLDGGLEMPSSLVSALRYLQIILRQRFRHDIELAEAPTIQIGDFDIEIEG